MRIHPFSDMRVRQLDAVVQLSPAQRTKLDFAAKKTIIPTAVARRIKVKDDFRKLAEAFAEKRPQLLSSAEVFDALFLSSARMPFFFPAERLEKFAATTLSKEQITKWTRFTDRRREAAIDAEAFAFGDYLAQIPLTSEQQIAAHQLLRRSIQAKGTELETAFAVMIDPNRLPAVATEQEFNAAIGEQNWAKLDEFAKLVLPIK